MDKNFKRLVGKSNKQLERPKRHVPKSIFGQKHANPKKSIWINKDLYTKLKLLTINHDRTNIKYWANKAIKHAFDTGYLK